MEPPTAPRLFVVHAPDDRAFVDGYLVPALGLPAADVLTSESLTPGSPRVHELERGAISPITVVVLSPALAASPWAAFADTLASTQAVVAASKLVPAILAAGTYSLTTQALQPLDFTGDPDDWEAEAGKLRALLDAPAPAVERPPCPYPGLRPFAAGDARYFFGRDREIDELLARVRNDEREIYVLGSSGSGKSSLIAAGLIPRIHEAIETWGERYAPVIIRPGADPVAVLNAALGVGEDFDSTIAHAAPDGSKLVLVIDQLEELFALAPPPARTLFFHLVRQLRRKDDVVLIFVLRSDFYGALRDSQLAADLDGKLSELYVAPLTGALLARAIEQPARAAGVSLEPALLTELTRDAANEPGTLPLLQETLVYLWSRLTRRYLRLADYRAMGDGDRTGLAVTVERLADSALRSLSAERTAIARRIFLRLVNFGDGRPDTRRQQSRSTFDECGDPAVVREVLDHLLARRLLIATGDGPDARVDLAHEVLLSAWPTLADWIKQRRAEEHRRRALEADADAWAARNKAGGLLDDDQLRELDAWLTPDVATDIGLSHRAAEFVRVSRTASSDRRAAAARRRQRVRLAVLILIAAVVIVILVFISLRQRAVDAAHRADEQRATAQRRLGENYVEQGRNALVDQGDRRRAIAYLSSALEAHVDTANLRVMFHEATRNLPVRSLEVGAPIVQVAFSRDGTEVVTVAKGAADARTIQRWDVATGREPAAGVTAPVYAAVTRDGTRALGPFGTEAWLRDTVTDHPLGPSLGTLLTARFSADGRRAVTVDPQGGLRMLHRHDEPLGPVIGAGYELVTISDDGRRLLLAKDGHLQLWDALADAPVGAPFDAFGGPDTRAYLVAGFNPAGDQVAIASQQSVVLWNLGGTDAVQVLQHADWISSIAYSPDGRRLVTGSFDNTARIWSVVTGELIATLPHDSNVTDAAFSPDGAWVVTGGDDGVVRIWDAATGRALTPALPRAGDDATWLLGGSQALLHGLYGAQRFDPITGGELGPRLAKDERVVAVSISREGTTIATSSARRAAVWTATDGLLLLEVPTTGPPQIALSADGARLAVIDGGVAQLWSVSERRPLPLASTEGVAHWVSFSPDGTRLAIGQAQSAGVWRADSGERVSTLSTKALVSTLRFSPDGRWLVGEGGDGVVRLWDLKTYRASEVVHADSFTAVAGPDGRTVVSLSRENARLWLFWEGGSGELATLATNALSAAFSADGTRLITAGDTIQVWDVESGQLLLPTLPRMVPSAAVAFDADDHRALVSGYASQAVVLDVAPDQHDLADWLALALEVGPQRHRYPDRNGERAALLLRYALEHRTPVDELERASNLRASAELALEYDRPLAQRFAEEAKAIDVRFGLQTTQPDIFGNEAARPPGP